jgi:uncharacterized protein YciI
VEYFVYCRDRPGAQTLRAALTEAHWTFMDRYADAMIARGPTLTADRTIATGSMHIVDLPDPKAAQVFAFDEPNYRAGVYADVLTRRWRNALGCTMWDFSGDPAGRPRFLIISHAEPGTGAEHDALLDEHRRYLARHPERFIVRGPFLSDDGTGWLGNAMLVEMRDRAGVEEMVAAEPFARAGLFRNIEIHDWQFGGRPAT